MATCSSCRKQIPDDTAHCPFCGAGQKAAGGLEAKRTVFGYAAPSAQELAQQARAQAQAQAQPQPQPHQAPTQPGQPPLAAPPSPQAPQPGGPTEPPLAEPAQADDPALAHTMFAPEDTSQQIEAERVRRASMPPTEGVAPAGFAQAPGGETWGEGEQTEPDHFPATIHAGAPDAPAPVPAAEPVAYQQADPTLPDGAVPAAADAAAQPSTPAQAAGPPQPINTGLFYAMIIGGMAGSFVLGLLARIMLFSGAFWFAGILASLSTIPAILSVVFTAILIYKAWAAIQDGQTKPTAGIAVGFLFIPFFNFYWFFVGIGSFGAQYNAYLQRHGLSAPQQSPGFFTATAVMFVVNFASMIVLRFIPVIGGFIALAVSLAYTVFIILLAIKLCSATNALARR